jgi:hypothetical protein
MQSDVVAWRTQRQRGQSLSIAVGRGRAADSKVGASFAIRCGDTSDLEAGAAQ